MVSKKVGLLSGGLVGLLFMVGCGSQVSTNTRLPSPAPDTTQTSVTPPPSGQRNQPNSNSADGSTTTNQTPTTPKATTFTMADVATHNTEGDCYTAIRGEVYNLSSFVNQHPGGDRAILSICGKDGTAAFVNQHGGRPRQENMLAGFKIGELAK